MQKKANVELQSRVIIENVMYIKTSIALILANKTMLWKLKSHSSKLTLIFVKRQVESNEKSAKYTV